jgi:nucleotide sugar dehydrogenase
MLFEHKVHEFIVNENANLEDLLKTLSKRINPNFGSGFAIVVDTTGDISGIVEDSDLRKFLFKFPDSQLNIKELMRKDFISVDVNLDKSQMISNVISQMDLRGWDTSLPVRIIPVLNNRKPVGLIDTEEIQLALQQQKSNYIVVGLGYVGLTLALSLAHIDRNVIGIDTDKTRINKLKKYSSYIYEPGIENLLKTHLGKNLSVGNSLFLISSKDGIKNIYFICIGSPLDSNLRPNLNNLQLAIEDLIKTLKQGDVIVMRSTVPIGFGNHVISLVESNLNWKVGVDFHYVAAPERTVEGNALKEIRDLPQILAGATSSCQLIGLSIFQNLSSSVTPVNKIEAAELIKLIGNAYRDYSFGFSNYFIEICQRYKLDINLIIEASNRGYPRSNIPVPSLGVGGPCLSKDSYFLPGIASFNERSPLVVARRVNELIPSLVVKFITQNIANAKQFKCLGIGIAFKGIPETNDFRNSPSIDFLELLKVEVSKINIWDSSISKNEVDLEFTYHSENDDYDFYAVLNNNPKNLDFLESRLLRCNFSEIIIFDPWRLLIPSQIKYSSVIKDIHYFSLSHYEKVSI